MSRRREYLKYLIQFNLLYFKYQIELTVILSRRREDVSAGNCFSTATNLQLWFCHILLIVKNKKLHEIISLVTSPQEPIFSCIFLSLVLFNHNLLPNVIIHQHVEEGKVGKCVNIFLKLDLLVIVLKIINI